MIDGHAFDQTNPAFSAVNIGSSDKTGTVLLRFVNAGLRMHVPSVAGLSLSLVAEDGNVVPEIPVALAAGKTPQPHVQSEVYLAAGKV